MENQKQLEIDDSSNWSFYEDIGWVDENGVIVEPVKKLREMPSNLNESDIESLIARVHRMDSKLVGLEAQYEAEKQALEINLGSQIKKIERVRESYVAFISDVIKPWLENELKRLNTKADGTSKSSQVKSVKLAKGSVGFRMVKTSIKAATKAEEKKAQIEWLLENIPQAIIMEPSIKISMIPEDVKLALELIAQGLITEEQAKFKSKVPLDVIPGHEKFEIKSGVK